MERYDNHLSIWSSSVIAAEQKKMKTMPRRMPKRPGQNTDSYKLHRRETQTPQNARRNYDRYLALAQAEARSGDRIAAENYYQHAEHYLRAMHESAARAHSGRAS